MHSNAREAHRVLTPTNKGGLYTMTAEEVIKWNAVDSGDLMRKITAAKFDQHADLAATLLETHPKVLVCDFPSDKTNMWGRALMAVRADIIQRAR